MGAWGDESCSNDSCWDLLAPIEDIHDFTQEEADKCLTEVFGGENDWAEPYQMVGTVIWVLRHGKKVEARHLEAALELLKTFNNEEHFSMWRDPKSRQANVLKEKLQMEHALAGDGTIPEEHIPGLMEKIADFMGGSDG